ncbi:MAG: helix-turn-helix domain-containing protein [Acidobacteriia bacterium]|nr:helix-turn-helix domain-containing protein [Terriglobia bacterium]
MSNQRDFLSAIGERVRKLRRARGWTQSQLAERAQLSPRFLAQLEAGDGNISVLRLAQVAEALHQPLRDLIPSVSLTERKPGGQVRGRKQIIALIGLRGAGKTSVGIQLAGRLKLPFVELDSLIEKAALMPLAQIFSLHGEGYYRRLEYQTLKELLRNPKPIVLATGGSLVTDPRTWSLVKQSCTSVWLKATPEVYWNRLLKQGDTRPMKNNPSAMTELRALLAAREPLYGQADHIIDTSRLSLGEATEGALHALGMDALSKDG